MLDASAISLRHAQQRGDGSQGTHITRVMPGVSEIGTRSARSVFVDEAIRDTVFGLSDCFFYDS